MCTAIGTYLINIPQERYLNLNVCLFLKIPYIIVHISRRLFYYCLDSVYAFHLDLQNFWPGIQGYPYKNFFVYKLYFRNCFSSFQICFFHVDFDNLIIIFPSIIWFDDLLRIFWGLWFETLSVIHYSVYLMPLYIWKPMTASHLEFGYTIKFFIISSFFPFPYIFVS